MEYNPLLPISRIRDKKNRNNDTRRRLSQRDIICLRLFSHSSGVFQTIRSRLPPPRGHPPGCPDQREPLRRCLPAATPAMGRPGPPPRLFLLLPPLRPRLLFPASPAQPPARPHRAPAEPPEPAAAPRGATRGPRPSPRLSRVQRTLRGRLSRPAFPTPPANQSGGGCRPRLAIGRRSCQSGAAPAAGRGGRGGGGGGGGGCRLRAGGQESGAGRRRCCGCAICQEPRWEGSALSRAHPGGAEAKQQQQRGEPVRAHPCPGCRSAADRRLRAAEPGLGAARLPAGRGSGARSGAPRRRQAGGRGQPSEERSEEEDVSAAAPPRPRAAPSRAELPQVTEGPEPAATARGKREGLR